MLEIDAAIFKIFCLIKMKRERKILSLHYWIGSWKLCDCGNLEAGAVKDALSTLKLHVSQVGQWHGKVASEAAGQPILALLNQMVGHLEGHVLLDVIGSPVILIDLDGWVLSGGLPIA